MAESDITYICSRCLLTCEIDQPEEPKSLCCKAVVARVEKVRGKK